MSAQQPLAYDSLKTVIQHMDATKRFELLMKCPSIRATEKAVPLMINHLEIQPLVVKVDGERYEITVNKQYKIGEDSVLGKPYDVDQYGFQDRSIEMTPGDVLVENGQRKTVEEGRQAENQEMHNLEQELEQLEQDLKTRKPPQTRIEEKSWRNLERNIRVTKYELEPHYFRRDTAKPFNFCVQFAMTSRNDRKRRFERILYHRKAHEAMKYMMEKLFGGRRRAIHVNNFEICSSYHQCFRLPLNIKFVIKNLRISQNVHNVLQAFRPILDDSSFPLDSICIGAAIEYEDTPLVKTGRKLVLNCNLTTLRLEGLSHNRVHFKYMYRTGTVLMNLVQHWAEHGREIGTYYSVDDVLEQDSRHFLNSLKELPGAKIGKLLEIRDTEVFECVILPMRNEAELNVSCQADLTAQDDDRWKIKIKVQPRGHANVSE